MIRCRRALGFTLIELVLVITVIGLLSTLIGLRLGTFAYWKEEAFLRSLLERISFLHRQAISDQAFYQLEFTLTPPSYRVGVLRPESDVRQTSVQATDDIGALTLELADFLNPSTSGAHTLIAPPSFPSLHTPQPFPTDVDITDIRTMSGKRTKQEGGTVPIVFSPRGFSEFAVLHFSVSGKREVTIVVNPFTGEPELIRAYRDFEWIYGKKK